MRKMMAVFITESMGVNDGILDVSSSTLENSSSFLHFFIAKNIVSSDFFLYFLFFLLFLYFLALYVFNAWKTFPGEPPVVWSFLPFFGHSASLKFGGTKFLKTMQKAYGDVFVITLAGRRMVIILNYDFLPQLLREEKLSFNMITEAFRCSALGLSSEDWTLIDHKARRSVESAGLSNTVFQGDMLLRALQALKKPSECLKYIRSLSSLRDSSKDDKVSWKAGETSNLNAKKGFLHEESNLLCNDEETNSNIEEIEFEANKPKEKATSTLQDEDETKQDSLREVVKGRCPLRHHKLIAPLTQSRQPSLPHEKSNLLTPTHTPNSSPEDEAAEFPPLNPLKSPLKPAISLPEDDVFPSSFRVELFSFSRALFTDVLTHVIFGENPSILSSPIVEHYRNLHGGFEVATLGMPFQKFWWVTYFRALKKMRDAILKTTASFWSPPFYKRMKAHEDFGVKDSKFLAVIDLWLTGLNMAIPPFFWMLARLVDCKKSHDLIEEEARSVLEKELRVDLESLKRMNYLDSIMKETMRYYQTVSIIRGATGPVELQVKDRSVKIRKNDWVGFFPRVAVHWNEDFYKNPQDFIFDRFVKDGPTKEIDNTKPLYPFGGGRHMCPARHVSVMLLKICVLHLILNFEFFPLKENSLPKPFVRGTEGASYPASSYFVEITKKASQ